MTLLAALDGTTGVATILDVSQRLAEVLGTDVEAVTVGSGAPGTAAGTGRRGLRLRRLDGDVVTALRAAAADATALVIGCRGSADRPAAPGLVTGALMTSLPGPLVVVPPDGRGNRPIRRVLVALDGTVETARALACVMRKAVRADVEVVAVHVLTPETVPAYADQPHHWSQAFSEEFAARNVPLPDVTVAIRAGDPPGRLLDAATELDADLIALAWSQDPSPGHAAVVRHAITQGDVPVLLTPVGPA